MKQTLSLRAANLDASDVVFANQYLVVFHRDARAFAERGGRGEFDDRIPVEGNDLPFRRQRGGVSRFEVKGLDGAFDGLSVD